MMELLTSAQMRAIEAAAIASGGVSGLELMERAGKGVVEAIFEEWPELALAATGRTGALPRAPGYLGQDEGRRAVVLCGPGNNGGDGFVVARLLKELGWEVMVFLYGDPERMPPDARVNYERWLGMGDVRPWPRSDDDPRIPYTPWSADLIVDALFGTGLTRPIPFGEANVGIMLPKWDLRDEPGRPKIVAVDVPSGLCADSGRILDDSDSLWADLTVTFHKAKVGHYLNAGQAQSGRIKIVSIGLEMGVPRSPFERLRHLPSGTSRPVKLVTAPIFERMDKSDGFGRETHKYSHGHALILCGPAGRGGAARLAARGALRIGAGVVTVGSPPDAMAENAARLDAIMLREVAEAGALAVVLEDTRINALCLGPGMGTGPREVALLAGALRSGRAMVLDADALTILARERQVFAALQDRCVLTPHAGEFARLFPDIAEKLAAPATRGPAYSKVDAAREAATRAGCVVLFKGPDTVIAAPDGECVLNSAHYDRAAPWLATAGSGDVLAGFIAGLLARGFDPFDAACTGAWLHVESALEFGPGLIAEDLPEQLPAVFRRVLK